MQNKKILFGLVLVFITLNSLLKSIAENIENENFILDSEKSTISVKKMIFQEESVYFEVLVCRKNTKKYAVKSYIECFDNLKSSKKLISTFYVRKDGCYILNSSFNYSDIKSENCSLYLEGLDSSVREEIKKSAIIADIFEIVKNGDYIETTIKIINKNYEDKEITIIGELLDDVKLVQKTENKVLLEGNCEKLILLKNKVQRAELLRISILEQDIIIFEKEINLGLILSEYKIKNDDYKNIEVNNSKIKTTNFEYKKTVETENNNKSLNYLNYYKEKECAFPDYGKLIALYTFLFLSVMLNIILIIRR
ncbi:MAG: hypothetical protein QXU20_03945 [Candidatus Woesearchaeota archaeon]